MFWVLFAFVGALVVSYVMMPKPKIGAPKPAGINELNVPTAESGREIPVLFGTRDLNAPNVVWYGDFLARPWKKEGQVAGYVYYLGMHQILCHGPIDNISRVSFAEKIAWEGLSTGGTFVVDAYELFGGLEREGGVLFQMDLEMGRSDQTPNSYLLAKMSSEAPAYRGVVGTVVYDPNIGGGYLGTSPYLKNMSYRGQRILTRQDGIDQWLPLKAPIGDYVPPDSDTYALAFAFDASGSAAGVANAIQKGGIVAVLSVIQDKIENEGLIIHLCVSYFGGGVSNNQFQTEDETPATVEFVDALIEWVNNITAFGDSAWDAATADIGQWFNFHVPASVSRRRIIVASDSNPSRAFYPYPQNVTNAAIGYLTTWAPGYTDDPCPYDTFGLGLPGPNGDTKMGYLGQMVAGNGYSGLVSSSTAYQEIVLDGFFGEEDAGEGFYDMNPAHVIRECLTDPDWGLGYLESDIDDTSFTAAANTLYSEALGVSLLWDKQVALEDFINEIIKHIDAVLYVSRSTGKFVLKLIRGDYNEEELAVLDETNIIKVANPNTPAFGELVNSVTVRFWNRDTGKDDSITVNDTAMVQMQGQVINSAIDYPGFTNLRNGTLAAQRDLRTLSSPFLSCTIYADHTARSYNVGDVFKFSWSAWQIEERVMRINGIAYGDGRNNQVRINCIEDVFATPQEVVVSAPVDGWVDPVDAVATASTNKIAFEAPYYSMVGFLGRDPTDTALAARPTAAYPMAAADRPGTAINAEMWANSGSSYSKVATLEFCPTASLVASMTKTTVDVTLTSGKDLIFVEVGTYCQIDNELCSVLAIDPNTGALTLGRAILDTVPAEHTAGAKVYFWSESFGFGSTEYASGDSVDIKLLPFTGAAKLSIDDAHASNVVMNQRAYRPYPPGDLRINSERYGSATLDGLLTVEWAHRNRLDASELYDHLHEDVGPEDSTVYRLRGYLNDALVHTEDNIAGTSATWTPSSEGVVTLEVHSKRDGVYSLWAPSHQFLYGGSEGRVTEENDELRGTEENDIRFTED